MKYQEIKQTLSQCGWNNASFQTIFSEYVPKAYELLNIDPLKISESQKETIDRHILHFFKPFCISARMRKWDLATFITNYKEFCGEAIENTSKKIVNQFRRDAEIREFQLIRNMGGMEYYKKLF